MGTSLGVHMIRIIISVGLCRGSLVAGNCHTILANSHDQKADITHNVYLRTLVSIEHLNPKVPK